MVDLRRVLFFGAAVALCSAALVGCGREEAARDAGTGAAATANTGAATAAKTEPSAPQPSAQLAAPSGRGAKLVAPKPPVVLVREVEFLTQGVVDRLTALSVKLQIRDFGGAADWFAADFEGHDPFSAPFAARYAMPQGAERRLGQVARAAVVDRDGLIASLRARIGPWRRVEHVLLKVHGAEFLEGSPPSWGRVDVSLELIGETEDGEGRPGGRESVVGRMWLGVVHSQGGWLVRGLELTELEQRHRAGAMFTDVTRSAGVHHEGLRFGRPGHDSDAWQGVGSADVDGDGWLDVFVPSSERNFLYLNNGDGTFREDAVARGLDQPGGGTGPLFFDADGDGWVDLALGFSAVELPDRSIDGSPLRFYRNLGHGRFADSTETLGVKVVSAISSLVAFDSQGDGWLDLFATSYGRMEIERNNSWLEASNGAPNHLLVSDQGKSFVDRTREAGLYDTRWSYAAAAADFDADGRQDLYVGNNFGSNRLYHNRGEGRFVDVAEELGVEERGNTMGVLFGDVNSDGRLDLYVVGPESAAGKRVLGRVGQPERVGAVRELRQMADGNALFLGAETGFEPAPDDFGARDAGWAFGSVLADLDLDSHADVFCVNGFVTGDLPEDT